MIIKNKPIQIDFSKPVKFVIDGDGVLVDYLAAFGGILSKTLGKSATVKNPVSYWAHDYWHCHDVTREDLEIHHDDHFWETMPAMPGAVAACKILKSLGAELICVTAIHEKHAAARQRNFLMHDFGIDQVIASGFNPETGESDKCPIVNRIDPAVFVDDYSPYFAGIRCHRALVHRADADSTSPNANVTEEHVDSIHSSLLDFAKCVAVERFS